LFNSSSIFTIILREEVLLREKLKPTISLLPARPNQSYVPLLVCVFHKSILLIVQYKYLKCYSKDLMLQNLILRTRLCSIRFFPQHCCVLDFRLINMIRRKYFVPGLYQLRKGKLAGLALKPFYMTHRVGRSCSSELAFTRQPL